MGCMGMRPDGDSEIVPVVWPPGTDLADNGKGIEYNGHVIEVGEAISGSGGEESSPGFEPPEECMTSVGYYAVLWALE